MLGIVFSCRQDRRLKELLRRGEPLGGEEALTKHVLQEETRKIQIRLVEGLPTSFLTSRGWLGSVEYVICLQRELSPEQRALVLRHELEHIRLGHLWFKGWANMGVFLYWWDPLIWLGYKYFCRDLELACDAAVLKELEPEERREYARTLVEMGAGRSLWSTPLCFGECDTAVRVKTAARPQRTGGAWRGLSWLTTVLLFLFFLGGPTQGVLAEDALLTWERGGGTVDTLVAHTMDQVRQNLGLGPILALQVWCVAEDGEHVWVVMELLEQGWVGGRVFLVSRAGPPVFYSCRGAEKAPGSDGGGAAVMKAGSIVLWSCSLLMEAFLGLSLLRWTFRYERAWLVLQKGECSGGPGPGGLGPGQIAYARPAAMVTGRAYVELGRREWAKIQGARPRACQPEAFMRQ